MHAQNLIRSLTLCATALLLPACASMVSRGELDDTATELRRADDDQRQYLSRLELQIDSLAAELRATLSEHQARMDALEGRSGGNLVLHFDYDDARLRPENHAQLDQFAARIREDGRRPVVTIEGFADPAGSGAYNLALGKRRAEAVADYLTGSAGIDPARLRVVSYGEAWNRLIDPQAWGQRGEVNRRAVVVIDALLEPASP